MLDNFHDTILKLIPHNSRVLDLGCGTGSLLARLRADRDCICYGVDREFESIKSCIEKGLPVFQGNLDEGLQEFQTQSFDWVILSQTLQAMLKPKSVLLELLRIGRKAIVSFPNFGYWQIRLQLLLLGKMPITKTLPNTWFNTPNLHMCTIKDFVTFCNQRDLKLTKSISLSGKKVSYIKKSNLNYKNLTSELGIFEIEK